MKDINAKVILILISIIIILICIFLFKVLSGNNNETPNISKVNYSKTEVIDLIKSENNKSNYAVEYTSTGTKYKIKYLNKKMKFETSTNDKNQISYVDFKKNTQTIVNEEKQTAIVQEISSINENYMSDNILNTIEDYHCTVEKEEQISNRNAVVLNYEGTKTIEDPYLSNPNNLINTNNSTDKNTNTNTIANTNNNTNTNADTNNTTNTRTDTNNNTIINTTANNTTNTNTNNNNEFKYNMKIWIDTETGLLLQTIITFNNIEQKTIYNLTLNSVTESDVTIPNLSKYEITDNRTK